MVLRGSGTAPDNSLPTQTHDYADSKEELKKIRLEVEDASRKAVDELIEHIKVEAAVEHGSPKDKALQRQASLSHERLDKLGSKLLELKEKQEQVQSDNEKRWREVQKTAMQLVCGGLAGALARSTVAPMDRVKILMQVAHVQKTSHLYPSMSKTAAHIIKTEGLTGFWRGNLTNCVRVVPHAATQFVTYDKIKVFMIGDSNGKLSVPQRLVAGSLSGVAAASVTQPLDVLRIRLQTDPEVKGKVGTAVRAMWAEGGLKTFYKGYTPAMLSLAPFIAVNFATFDTLKGMYYPNASYSKQELKDRNPLVVLSLGALSGIIAQTVCYPLDTVRRRMQIKGRVYPSTPMAFVTILRDEGPIGFYRGMVPNALKVMPNNALRFAIYETLKNWFLDE